MVEAVAAGRRVPALPGRDGPLGSVTRSVRVEKDGSLDDLVATLRRAASCRTPT